MERIGLDAQMPALDKRDAFITACFLSERFIDMPKIYRHELRLMRIQKSAEPPKINKNLLDKVR